MRRRLVVLVVVAMLSACGVQADSSPRDLPDDEQQLPVIGGGGGTEAAGGDRIYLVGPGEDRLLRSVPRSAGTTPLDLIRVLLLGPNDDELADQYSTNIPPETAVHSARKQGQFLTIDLSDDITGLTPQSLIQAIAQIVYTATAIDGVETVRIEVDDESRVWPTATGEPKADLRVYDYPNLVQSAQPAYPAVPAVPEN
jgi:hypothetical protein